MNLSKDTKSILEFLDHTTNDGLRKRNDIGTILEMSASYNELDTFENLLFNGSALWNIHQTLKRNINDNENTHKLKAESLAIANDIKQLLEVIIGDEYQDINDRFDKTYYVETAGSFSNLIDLSHDLSQVKNLVARMKESNKFAKKDNSSESSK
ncbi:MAG: hypothetical protein V1779_07085 [bacterium]